MNCFYRKHLVLSKVGQKVQMNHLVSVSEQLFIFRICEFDPVTGAETYMLYPPLYPPFSEVLSLLSVAVEVRPIITKCRKKESKKFPGGATTFSFDMK